MSETAPDAVSALDLGISQSGKPFRQLFRLLSTTEKARFILMGFVTIYFAAAVPTIAVVIPLVNLLERAQMKALGVIVLLSWYPMGFQWILLVLAWMYRRTIRRGFPDGFILPTCLHCGYSLAGLADDQGWRVCPECNHKSPDRIRIGFARVMGVYHWPVVRPRTD